MEKVKEFLKKLPDWVKAVVASAVIVAVAVVVNDVVNSYIYKNAFRIKKDDFSCVFQIEKAEKTRGLLILDGWIFKLDEDSVEDDFEIILYDYNKEKKYYMDVEDVVREDVNEYFLCEYDYSKSGFSASVKLDKVNLNEKNYEVLIRPKEEQVAYMTGVYLLNGELVYAKPEEYKALEVAGTDLEEVVVNGVLRVYRADVGMYVYQHDDKLYWIAEQDYEFFEETGTPIAYQLWTTQNDKLPKHRLENNWFFDNITFNFEIKEVVCSDKYRVAVAELPQEYAITEIETGQYIDKWLWNHCFRPWYEFE